MTQCDQAEARAVSRTDGERMDVGGYDRVSPEERVTDCLPVIVGGGVTQQQLPPISLFEIYFLELVNKKKVVCI